MADQSITTVPDTAAGTLGLLDRLLLVFAELEMYGIAARDAEHGPPDRARRRLAAELRARAPHGLGSSVFRIRDEAGPVLRLYTSGPEVDRAVVAACAHHGLEVRLGGPGVVLARPARSTP